MKNEIFWKNDSGTDTVGGFFIRNDLFKFFANLKEQGLNPVGIKVGDDWNLEVIVERNQAYLDRYEK